MIYDSFDDVPSPDQIPAESEVHAGGRKWKWDGDKWTLFSEGSVGGIQFEAEMPIYRNVNPIADSTDVNVTHFFDMNDLTELQW